VPKGIAGGLLAAGITVLIWAAYPVATRAALGQAALAEDLVFLRFCVGVLCFVPYLLLKCRDLPAATWRAGIPLAACQGAGMASLVICGLQYAPASHAAALGPGASPAWIALFGLLLYSRVPTQRHLLGAMVTLAGIVVILLNSEVKVTSSVAMGDGMFLAASALGSLYVLRLRAAGINPMLGAAMVASYSAVIVGPWYLWRTGGLLPQMPAAELLWQAAWQGVLIGFASLVAMNHAILRLGFERAASAFAFVPALTAVLGGVFLAEVPSFAECVAIATITAGVAIGALPARRVRAAVA